MSGHAGIGHDLLKNSTTANGLEQLYATNAAQANPAGMLTAEAVSPSGYSPSQIAAQTTAAEQSAGGANAGAVGGALRRAAATRNAGAAAPAIAGANRAAGQELSGLTAGIQTRNADLQQKQRQQGISGLESLYGENVGAGENALGLSSGALKDAGSLSNFWQDLLMQGLKSGGQVAAAAAGG